MNKSYAIMLCLSLIGMAPSLGQVGIGTTNPNVNAILDITSTDKGVLLPRIPLKGTTDAAPMSAHVAGMVIYNTATATDVTPGFYYNNGSTWVRLGVTQSNDWTITGNTGTNTTANFIGTKDNVGLKFRTNDTERFQVLNTGEVAVGAPGTIPTLGDTFSANGTEYPIVAKANGTSPGILLSSAYYGIQTGKGAIVFGQHRGTGEGLRMQMENNASTDAGISVQHNGIGPVITGQTQGTASITGILTVADFSFTGTDLDDHIGVSGYSHINVGITPGSDKGIGVQGTGGTYGVHGIDNSAGRGGVAVFATGDTGATGTKAFMIDHPLDPANKILKHFAVESNEVLNIYRGVAQFNGAGEVTITLPDYYAKINKNANYQMMPIGGAMPNLFVKSELQNHGNTFVLGGGTPGKKVSWMVTAERNDAYLQQYAHKRENTIDKRDNRGKYLMPELYNQPKEKRIGYKPLKQLKKSEKNLPNKN